MEPEDPARQAAELGDVMPARVNARSRHLAAIALAAMALGGLGAPAATATSATATAPALTNVLATSTATDAGTLYQPTTPRRVLDGARLGAGGTRTITFSDLPAGTRAVSLNVTARNVTGTSYVSACAGTTATEECRKTSFLNPVRGLDTAGTVIAALGGAAGNQVTLYNNAAGVELVADLQGIYVGGSAGSAYTPTEPRRALSEAVLGPRGVRELHLPDAPTGATAVVLNLTSSKTSVPTFVSACPAGTPLASCTSSSAVNPMPGLDIANRAVVKLGGADGKAVMLYNNAGTTTLHADVHGYFVDLPSAPTYAGRFVPTRPQRVVAFTPLTAGQHMNVTLPSVPAGAIAAAVAVTAPTVDVSSYLSGCPAGSALESCKRTSVLNPRPAADTSNGVFLRLGGAQRTEVMVYNNASTARVVVDLQGYFVAPDPAALGVLPTNPALPSQTAPGPDNTGVPAGTPLRVHQGDLVVTTPNAVIQNLDVRGFVTVRAPGVVIRNTVVRGGTTTSSRGLVTVDRDTASLTIEDSELAPTTPSPWIDGLRGWNITARRLDIHHVIDAAHIYGPNVTIENSWLHDNVHYESDPNWNGGPSHDDSIQIQVGTNIRIRNNTITGATGAAIQLTQDRGTVADVQITGNFLDGGGCTVNFAEKGRGPFQSVTVSDNKFGRNTGNPDCAIIAPTTTIAVLTTSNNTFTDGTPARVRRG